MVKGTNKIDLKPIIGVAALMGLIVCSAANAKVADAVPTAESWAKQWQSENHKPGKGTFLTGRVIAVKKEKNVLKLVNLDAEEIKGSTMSQVAEDSEAELAIEVNRPIRSQETSTINPCMSSVLAACSCLSADLVIEMVAAKWRLSFFDAEKNSLKVLALAGAGKVGAEGKWVASQIRYDGIVVDSKDGYFLALIANKNDNLEFQALALKNSEQVDVIPAGLKSDGSALLSSVSTWSNFAVFTLVTGDTLPIGTKLVIEDKKSKGSAKKSANEAAKVPTKEPANDTETDSGSSN
jgi:hypothetical protein